MMNSISWLPPELQLAMRRKLVEAGFKDGEKPTDSLPFRIALIDAACCHANPREVLMPETTISKVAARLNSFAPLIVGGDESSILTMAPDQSDHAACPPDRIARQWHSTIQSLAPGVTDANFQAVSRPKFYAWLANAKKFIKTDELPEVDFVLRCTDETKDYANLGLTVNLAQSQLLDLPSGLLGEGLSKQVRGLSLSLPERLMGLGHMNSIVVVGEDVPDEALRSNHHMSHVRSMSMSDMVRALMRLFIPDTHVQPDYRGVTTPLAIWGEGPVREELSQILREISWVGVDGTRITEVETLSDASALQAEISGFWKGPLIHTSTETSEVVIITNGVTRQPAIKVL